MSTLRGGTPLTLAALGGLFSVRAGIFHLGIEGLMLGGAFAGVAAAQSTGSLPAALVIAVAACLALSLLYWFIIDVLGADSVIAGLGLTTLTVGATELLLQALYDTRGNLSAGLRLPRPVTGAHGGLLGFVSELSILVWLTPVAVLVTFVLLRRAQFGLRITAVGEYTYGARAAGIDPSRVRLAAVCVTGVFSALAGIELALGGLSTFTPGMTNGRGFIALAAILLGARHPVGTAFAALFFGLADAVGVFTQLHSIDLLPRQFVLMIPFVLTVLAVLASAQLQRGRRRRIDAGS